MRLSAPAEYAIRILTFMSLSPDRTYSAMYLYEELNLPYKYITKLMTSLAKKNLVVMKRGRSGGFQLAHTPADVSVMDILITIDKGVDFDRCILGFSKCSDKNPCAMHEPWVRQKEHLIKALSGISLQNLCEANFTQF